MRGMIRHLSVTTALSAFLLLGSVAPSNAAIATAIFGDPVSSDFGAWDVFSGAYAGPHAAHSAEGFTDLDLSVTPGGFMTGNLYAFTSTPTYTFENAAGSGLADVKTLIFQVDVNQELTGVSLNYNGQIVNALYSQATGSGQSASGNPTFTYAWQFDLSDLVGVTDNNFVITATGLPHTTLAQARIDVSTQAFDTNILPVPEPGVGGLALLSAGAAVLGLRRRLKRD